jgi:hypothetical protein
MGDHAKATETKPMSQERDANAPELIRDWELLFWGFLLFGLAHLAWVYLYRQDNAFQLGVLLRLRVLRNSWIFDALGAEPQGEGH